MPVRFVPTSYKMRKLGKIACSCLLGMLGTSFVSMTMMGVGGSAFADSVVIDGTGGSGFLIDAGVGSSASPLALGGGANATLGRYEGGTLQLTTSGDDVTVFTNFSSRGGNGSGGGAGLGGVFFVDQGAVLKLEDVVFSGNSVRGGDGGSDPAIRLGNKQVVLQPKSLDLIEIDQQLATPNIIKDGAEYKFWSVDVSATGADLLALGSPITFDTLTGDPTAAVSIVTGPQKAIFNPEDPNDSVIVDGDTVTLDRILTLNANDVSQIAPAMVVEDQNGVSVVTTEGYEITANNTIDFTNASAAQMTALKDSVQNGSTVFIGSTGAQVTNISYDDQGDIETLTVSENISGATGQLDVISVNAFKLKQFTVSGNTVNVKSEQTGFEVGMQLFDADGSSLGVEIQSVAADGKSFTVNNATALASVNAFEARKSPILSSNEIEVSSGIADSFYVGATVNFSDISETATITGITETATGTILTLSDPLTGIGTLEQRVASGDEIGVELRNVKSASGQTIVVQASGLSLEPGMILQGDGIAEGTEIAAVGTEDVAGFVTLTINGNITGSVSAIVAKSPLSKGGAMNSLVAAGAAGNGGNGFNKNGFSSFFNGGEGQEGTRGYAGDDGDGGAGGDGGYGGNGSDGMPINPNAIRTLKSTTSAFLSATGELAAAVFPDPVAGLAVPIPDPLEIATKTFKFAGKSLDFATAVYENVQWGINLSRGIAGMGGDGGEGGEGGSGDEFFGGGAGGSGGAGGEGALSFTDGGNGGDGGRGGNGGFGAGGGSGGAGGDEGSTGAADGGDPGDGGFGGFAAGDGSNGDGLFGGGGSGFGGAIFVRETGTLVVSGNAHFQRNNALGGSSNNLGAAGDGAGAAIFMMKGSSVTLAPGNGNVITFDDDIADDSAATYEGAPFAEGAGADLIIHADGGLVELNAENSYSGNTILRGATLAAELGTGVNDASRLVFDGTGKLGTGTLNRDGTGTLLITENFTDRRVGNDYGVKWSGSGGFAAATSGVSVVLGEYLPGEGQVLTWGQDGFFETSADEVLDSDSASEDKVLTFGSEFSKGFVNFVNDVVVPGTNSASVAVFNTGTAGNASTAILSGDWTGNELKVGDAAGSEFTGDLYMTGTNALEQLMVLGGKLSTYNPFDMSASGTLFASTADVIVASGSELDLRGAEALNSASVENGGALYLHADFDADTVSNLGLLNVGETADLDVQTTLSNGGTLLQSSEITSAGNVIHDGMWSLSANQTINVGTGLTGSGDICLETFGEDVQTCNGENEAATAVTLTLNQGGDSTFDGRFVGLGALDKRGAGDLELTAVQTFVGGLNIGAGTISTSAQGTMADTLNITVGASGTYDVGVVDTIRDLDNEGTVVVRADLTTTSGVDNDGTVNLRADLTTGADMNNDGAVVVFDDRSITTATLTGSGSIKGNAGDEDLTLNQSGVSTFAGEISNLTNLHKTGAGTLTLTGTNVYSGTAYVDVGKLVIGSSAAMDAGNDYEIASGAVIDVNAPSQTVSGSSVEVLSGGTLNIATNLQLNAINNKSGAVVNSEADFQTTSLKNDGTWNILTSHAISNTTLTGAGNFVLQDDSRAATTLDISQAGNSTFGGQFTGVGNLTKSSAGTLTLTNAQNFSGSLNVTAGAVVTQGSATLSDQLDVVVGPNGSLTLGVSDTLATVKSSGTLTVNQTQSVSSFDVLAGVTTLNAALTTTAVSDTLNLAAPGRLLVADEIGLDLRGGLSGDGSLELVDDASITLGTGTISTFRGTISEAVASADSTLTINGGGELRLARTNPEGLDRLVTIDKLDIQNGIVALDGSQLLSDGINVNVATQGDFVLLDDVSGTPRYENINQLTGSGEIYLNTNTLNVNSGGSFEGTFFGNGSVNVQDGQFTISNSLSSSDGTLDISSDDGTTVAAGTTVDVAQVNVNQNSTLNVSGSDDGAGLSVVRATGLVVHTTSTLHMGSDPIYADGHADHSLIEAASVLINGSYTGNGTIASSTIDITADAQMATDNGLALVSPGNSPGIQVFDAERITFGENSELRIEVEDNSFDAGIGFDQIVVTEGSRLYVEGSAKLSILSGEDADYSLGQLTQFASFDVDAISGSFGEVTHNGAVEEFAINLATGNIVGLMKNGVATNLDTFAVTENQKAIIEAIEVSDSTGAKQYYGGTFVEDLTAASANNRDENDVFNRASPESYAAMIGAAQLVTSQVLPQWKSSYAPGADNQKFFTNFSTTEWASGDQTVGDLKFGASSGVGMVGYAMGSDMGSIVLSAGQASAKMNGDYISGKSNGAALGAAAVFNHSDSFSTNVGFSVSDMSFDGQRLTNNGKVDFSSVDVSASEFALGAEYSPELRSGALSLSAAVAFGTVNTPDFSEVANQTNLLNALDMSSSKNDFTRLDLGVKYASPVAGNDSLFAEVNASVHSNSGMNIEGSYDEGQAVLGVKSDGFKQTQVSAALGYQMSVSETTVATVKLGSTKDWTGKDKATGSIGLRMNF